MLANHFAKFNGFIAQAKADGCKTLVHCQVGHRLSKDLWEMWREAGMNRSAGLCAAPGLGVSKLM